MKLRASFSFLNMWQQGKVQDALLSYFHVPKPTPPQYVNGRKWDDYSQVYINKHQKLPVEWGGDKLSGAITQNRVVVPYNEMCDLVTVWDILVGTTLWELKSGHSYSARAYAKTMQVPLYLLAAKLAQIPVKKAIICRYNAKDDQQDRAIIYPTRIVLERATNFLDSLVPEIHKYFEDNDLFTKTDVEMATILQSL